MQKKNVFSRLLACICLLLLAAATLSAYGCKKPSKYQPGTVSEGGEFGQGSKCFVFTVTDGEGKDYVFTIHTDASLVGSALTEMGLVQGEQGTYGLYVKVVNGIVADYDADGTYWAFYINGDYAMTGIDQTPLEDGASYQMKVEKF